MRLATLARTRKFDFVTFIATLFESCFLRKPSCWHESLRREIQLVVCIIMSTAIAINSIIFNVARIIGPAVAGALIYFTDIAWAFLVNAVSYAALIAALALS